tara:strand:+ start:1351 stop:1713 length:363 start_codon:yes stop_codon:yes gene_type:complete
MKTNYLKITFFGILIGASLLSACSKHAEKVADAYIGVLNKNDTLVSSNAEVLIKEVDNNKVSVASDAFPTYEVEIDKQRYWGSKTYFSIDSNETLEVSVDGLLLIHSNDEGDLFLFRSNL